MKNTLLTLIGVFVISAFFGCDQSKPYSDTNNTDTTSNNTEWKFKVVTIEDEKKTELIIVDKNDNPIKFDDDIDYSEYDIIRYAFYAKMIYMTANNHDYEGNYYFSHYDYVNQNINYVFNLPIKDEIHNKEILDLFNRTYYDHKSYSIYHYKEGYGQQSFIMSNDGRIHRGYYDIITNPIVYLERNKDGNIKVYSIGLPPYN